MQASIAQAFSNKTRLAGLIVASIILFYFIFAPSINMLYYAADDFRYSFGGLQKSCGSDDGFYFAITLGRPLQSYIDCWSYKFAYTLERMRIIRLIAVICLGCGMGLFADFLCSLRFSIANAFLAAGSLFLVHQLYAAPIAMGAIPLPVTILLVLLAYRCINNAHLYFSSKESTSRKIAWIALASLLLFGGLITYPAMVFFYGTLVLMKVLFSPLSNWPATRREVIREVVLFGSVCVIYFILSYLNMHFNPQAPVPDAYRLDHPNLNLTELLQRVMVLGNIFTSSWAIFPSGNIAVLGQAAIVLFVGAMIFGFASLTQTVYFKEQKKSALINLAQATVGTVLLLGFSSGLLLIIPNLTFLNGEHWLRFATIASGLALLFWSIYQWSNVLPPSWRKSASLIVFGLWFLIAGYQANIVMLANAAAFEQTLNSHMGIISDYLTQGHKLKRIHFVVPKTYYPYDKFFITNGALARALGNRDYELKWCSLARGVPGEEKDHQKELLACINSLPANGIAVTYSYPQEPFAKSKDMLLVNKEIVSNADYFQRYMKIHFNLENWNAF